MKAGETDNAEIVKNKEKNSQKMTACFNYIGNLDIDILYEGCRYYVLKMNARFGDGYPFIHLAGVNLPLAIINWIENKYVDDHLIRAKIGIKGQKDLAIIEI